jgi:hypothetical protein
MFLRSKKTFLVLKTLLCIFFSAWAVSPAFAGKGPVIAFEKTSHAFDSVYEGELLSHSFTVTNRGDADLHIKKVTTS